LYVCVTNGTIYIVRVCGVCRLQPTIVIGRSDDAVWKQQLPSTFSLVFGVPTALVELSTTAVPIKNGRRSRYQQPMYAVLVKRASRLNDLITEHRSREETTRDVFVFSICWHDFGYSTFIRGRIIRRVATPRER